MSISRDTIGFLKDLKLNNHRSWFQENKSRYDLAQQDVIAFLQEIIDRLSLIDAKIPQDLSASKCLFRIYRDVRFSKNKLPYKEHFAAGISATGRKINGPEYYIHIEPGNKSFLATGYWRPESEHLSAIRQEIDYSPDSLIRALNIGGWNLEDLDDEDKLVRPPKNYSATHPYIEILKLKSFVLFEKKPDDFFTSPDAVDKILTFCERVIPFNNFLREAIEPESSY